MKLRHSLFLLLALFLLIGLYWGLGRHREYQVERARESRQVFSFSPLDIQRLSVKRIAEEKATAERVSETEWRITEPNPTIIPFDLMWDRVAEHVASLSNEHTVLDDPASLAPYGLDAPALEIEATLNGDITHRLYFGAVEPTQRCRYARVDEGPLFLVNTNAFFELDRSLYDLRHRYLVENRDLPILRLEFAWIWTGPPKEEQGRRIETGDESITVAVERASEDAPWYVVAPFEALARHEQVEELAKALQFAAGKAFIDNPENLSDYGLDPAHARISFQDPQSGARKTIWLGMAEDTETRPGLFVKALEHDSVFVIEAPLLNLLPTSPGEWRDLRLLTRRVSEMNKLIYTRGPERFVLAKGQDGAWRLEEPTLEAANPFAINGFLSFIKEVEGSDFVEGEQVKDIFKTPETRITLFFEDDTSSEILLAPNPDTPGSCYARQDNGAAVLLSGVAVDMLYVDGDTFRSLELFRFLKSDVRDITLQYKGRDYNITRRHDSWVATAPEDFQLENQSDITTLIDAVCPLQAVGIADTRENMGREAPFGLDKPVFSLEIVVGAENTKTETLTLHIGGVNSENPSERYAHSSMRTGIYKINQEVMDKIREALRGFK